MLPLHRKKLQNPFTCPRNENTPYGIRTSLVNAASLVERHDRAVDIDGDMAAMSEAGLHDLRAELTELDAEVSSELRRTVADNYKPFIQASQVGTCSQAGPKDTLIIEIAPQHCHHLRR